MGEGPDALTRGTDLCVRPIPTHALEALALPIVTWSNILFRGLALRQTAAADAEPYPPGVSACRGCHPRHTATDRSRQRHT